MIFQHSLLQKAIKELVDCCFRKGITMTDLILAQGMIYKIEIAM